jgi:hypothetical protein
MVLVLFALSMRPVGVVSTLSTTTPVLILPLLWLVHGVRPAPWRGLALLCRAWSFSYFQRLLTGMSQRRVSQTEGPRWQRRCIPQRRMRSPTRLSH